jgi:hypothetical protein
MINRQCVIKNCIEPGTSLGMCGKHYQRVMRGQQLNEVTRYDRRPAIIEGKVAKIPLGINAKHGYSLVDSDQAYLDKYNWTKGTRGYPTTHIDGKNVYLHHLIVGKPQPRFVVDHINRDALDNRRENLRFVSQRVNATNKQKQSNNTSGHVGVCYEKRRKKWFAQIVHNKSNKFLGYYATQEEAIVARKAAELASEHFVESMNLNKEK